MKYFSQCTISGLCSFVQMWRPHHQQLNQQFKAAQRKLQPKHLQPQMLQLHQVTQHFVWLALHYLYLSLLKSKVWIQVWTVMSGRLMLVIFIQSVSVSVFKHMSEYMLITLFIYHLSKQLIQVKIPKLKQRQYTIH